jgi:hypothetical protein
MWKYFKVFIYWNFVCFGLIGVVGLENLNVCVFVNSDGGVLNLEYSLTSGGWVTD